MRRGHTVLLLALAATLTLGVMPANAAIDDVFATQVDVADGVVTDVHGFISCTSGMDFFIRVNVTDEDGNKAIGRVDGTCGEGAPSVLVVGTNWTTSEVRGDSGFVCGELVVVRGQARTPEDGASSSFNQFFETCGGNDING